MTYNIKIMKVSVLIIIMLIVFTTYSSAAIPTQSFTVDINEKPSHLAKKKAVTTGWFISSLYVAYFNRAPDFEGVKFWGEKVKAGRTEGKETLHILKELSALFAKHPVFLSTYGSLDDTYFVNRVYINVLGHIGDSEGVKFWISELEKGKSRSDMVAEFVEATLTSEVTSEVFPTLSSYELLQAQKRQDLLLNKAIVSYSFSSKLKEQTNLGQSRTDRVAKLTTVEQDPAYLASKKILRGITADRDTVTKKRELIDRLFGFENPMDRLLHDTTPPTITLNAKRAIRIHVGDEYTPPNVVAMDDIDGEVEVTKSGDVVNTNSAGDYRVVYSAVDSQNNKSSVTRRVEVIRTYVPPPSYTKYNYSTDFGTKLFLSDDSSHQFAIPFQFKFYDTFYSELYVNSNGNITFINGDWDFTESSSEFINDLPRISPFWDDLDSYPVRSDSTKGIFVNNTFSDRIIVTWLKDPAYAYGGSNTIQVTLFKSGMIVFSYQGMTEVDAIVGLSPANGASATQVDFDAVLEENRLTHFSNIEAIFKQYTSATPFNIDGKYLVFHPNSSNSYDMRIQRSFPHVFGHIEGVVTDIENEPVANVEVHLSSSANLSYSATAMTDIDGYYLIEQVPIGAVRVEADIEEDTRFIGSNVLLEEGGTVVIDLIPEQTTEKHEL